MNTQTNTVDDLINDASLEIRRCMSAIDGARALVRSMPGGGTEQTESLYLILELAERCAANARATVNRIPAFGPQE